MTLLDLWMLLKRNWVLVVALPIACAAVCWGAITVMPSTYSATATLVASAQLGALNGQTASVVLQRSAETGLEISSTQTAATQSVAITVKGPDADECVRVANETAEMAREEALVFLGQDPTIEGVAEATEAAAAEALTQPASSEDAALYALALLSNEEAVTISITDAIAATDVSPSKTKYALVAFIAGLLLAICIVVIRDMARGSIHNVNEMEELYDLRLLGRVDDGRRRSDGSADAQAASLLAAIDFAGDDARALCLVPMESAASAVFVVATLEEASEKAERTLAALRDAAGLPLTDAESLVQQIAARMQLEADLALVVAPAVAESADYAYLAPACGKAVLVLEAMRSKRVHVEDALRQLALSNTEVAGFIMVNGR